MNLKSTDNIVQKDNPVLRRKAKQVTRADIGSPEFKYLITHMRKLLAKEENGVGLAAPQVGVPAALFIVAGRIFEGEDDLKSDIKNKKSIIKPESEPHPLDRVFINPKLIRTSRKKAPLSEGCLSVRGTYGTVLRHEKASIKAQDEAGKPITINATGLLVHIFQHEMDHLEGVLFIDKAISLNDEQKRDSNIRMHANDTNRKQKP